MMSEVVRYEIKNFITWTLDFETIDTKNPGRSVRNELNWTGFLRKRFYIRFLRKRFYNEEVRVHESGVLWTNSSI